MLLARDLSSSMLCWNRPGRSELATCIRTSYTDAFAAEAEGLLEVGLSLDGGLRIEWSKPRTWLMQHAIMISLSTKAFVEAMD